VRYTVLASADRFRIFNRASLTTVLNMTTPWYVLLPSGRKIPRIWFTETPALTDLQRQVQDEEDEEEQQSIDRYEEEQRVSDLETDRLIRLEARLHPSQFERNRRREEAIRHMELEEQHQIGRQALAAGWEAHAAQVQAARSQQTPAGPGHAAASFSPAKKQG
jgi:hypothetical protein